MKDAINDECWHGEGYTSTEQKTFLTFAMFYYFSLLQTFNSSLLSPDAVLLPL